MKAKIMFIAIVSVSLLLVPCALAKRAEPKPDAMVKSFKKLLVQDGFHVTEGAVGSWNLVEQWCAGDPDVESALYLNNEPYLSVLVPKSAEEPDHQPQPDFKLEPDEAIVLIGLTPPPVKYFSYTPYLSTRKYPYSDERTSLLASLGDGVNNATVKSIGSTPYNSPVVLIFTPDQGTDARVRSALRRAGYPAAIINTVVFPVSLLKLGNDEADDELRIVARTSIWLTEEGTEYINNPPLSVFRVRPSTGTTANPFPEPRLSVRGTGRTEMYLMTKLEQLRQDIIDDNQNLNATDITPIPMAYEGYDYIQRLVDPSQWQGVWGDSRDAFYLGVGMPEWSPNYHKITLKEDEFLMVYGVNHVATGKATYMNINFYASEDAKLTLGTLDDRDFPGAAEPFGDLMYAYKVSRSCGSEANCLQLSPPEGCTRLTIDDSTLLGIFTRIYVEPATKVGPAMQEILYDRVIKFSQPLE